MIYECGCVRGSEGYQLCPEAETLKREWSLSTLYASDLYFGRSDRGIRQRRESTLHDLADLRAVGDMSAYFDHTPIGEAA